MKKVLLLLLFANALMAQPAYHFDLLKDINTTTRNTDIKFIKNIGNGVVVLQMDRDYNTETFKLRIWSYDGKTLKNFASSDLIGWNSKFTMCQVIDDYIFFHLGYGDPNFGLFVVKLGSPDIKKVAVVHNPTIVKYGSEIYYSDAYNGVFHYNKITNESTSILPENASFFATSLVYYTGTRLYFIGIDNVDDFNAFLWVSDGTSEGTHQLKDSSQQPLNILVTGKIGNRLIFDANDSIYISDGTEPGTYPFISMNSFKSSPADEVQLIEIYNANDKAFLSIKINNDHQLWVTDGTAANTRFFSTQHNFSKLDNDNNEIASKDGFLFFITNYNQLAKTDGNTVKILTNPLDIYSTVPLKMTNNPEDNNLYFNLLGKFYKTDGTTNGTKLISDKQESPDGSNDTTIPFVIAYNKILAFIHPVPVNRFGNELYEINADTIKVVKDLDSTTKSFRVQFLLNNQGKSYFSAEDDITTYGKVYETDGTPEGTRGVEVGILNPMFLLFHFFSLNKDLYQIVNNELRRINFSTNQAEALLSLPKGPTYNKPIQSGKKVYFLLAEDPLSDTNRELWVTNGTSVGTRFVKTYGATDRFHEFAVHNQQLYVFTTYGNTIKIWKFIDDTKPPILLKTINASRVKTTYSGFQGKLAILVDVEDSMQLWVIDGTSDAVSYLNSFPPRTSFELQNFYFTDNFYYYSAYADNRTRVWKSEGTAEATVLIADEMYTAGDVKEFCLCNNAIFFGLNKTENTSVSYLYKHDLPTGTTTFLNTTGIQRSEEMKHFYCLEKQLYFPTHGNKTVADRTYLYTSDGTAEGTKDILKLENNQDYLYATLNGDLYPLNDKELLVNSKDKFYSVEWFTFRKCDNPTNLSGTTADSKIQSSSTFIESTEKLTGESRVAYFAPKSITLKAGFSVDNTSVFKAEIKNRVCNLRQ
jgi:hypothetical protein